MSSPSSTSARLGRPGLVLTAVAVVAVLAGALVGGAAVAPALGDPGPLVRWGALLARVIHDLAAAATVGLLVLAAFLARRRPGPTAASPPPVWRV